jgi:site-specific recombinase XerD
VVQQFIAAVTDVTPIAVQQFFVGLQHRSASHQRRAFRTLRTFFRWCIEIRALTDNPLRDFTMRTPMTLPTVRTGDELRAVLTACPATLEDTRNRVLILVLADPALRSSEALNLLGGRLAGSRTEPMFVGPGKAEKAASVTSSQLPHERG